MPCHIPDLAPLRDFLKRFEVADCNCPLYLSCPCLQECDEDDRADCPHCLGQCDCKPMLFQPPCKHVREPDPADVILLREWATRLWGRLRDDVNCLERLYARAYADEYLDPPTPDAADLRTASRAERILVMSKRRPRKGKVFAIRHPYDRWTRQDREEVEEVVGRSLNGSIVPKGLRHRV